MGAVRDGRSSTLPPQAQVSRPCRRLASGRCRPLARKPPQPLDSAPETLNPSLSRRAIRTAEIPIRGMAAEERFVVDEIPTSLVNAPNLGRPKMYPPRPMSTYL